VAWAIDAALRMTEIEPQAFGQVPLARHGGNCSGSRNHLDL
jgi:hypothetical protein